MPKTTGKQFCEIIAGKISELEKMQEKSKHPLVHADSVKVLTRIRSLLTPELAASTTALSKEEIQPFRDFLIEQEKLQDTIVGYFMNPESRGNQLCFCLAQHMSEAVSVSKTQLLLSKLSKADCLKINAFGYGEEGIKKLKGFLLSEDHQRLVDIKACLLDAMERKETSLRYAPDAALTQDEARRVAGHSAFVARYFEELKKYAAEASLPEMNRLKGVLTKLHGEFSDQVRSDTLELQNTFGDASEKRLVEAIFATLTSKKDLVDFVLNLKNRKRIDFVNTAYKHLDLYKLILDGAKNVDDLLAREMPLQDLTVATTYVRQFLVATAYSIERNRQANVSWSGWVFSLAPELTGVHAKAAKLNCNDALMHFLSLPPTAIQVNSVLRFAQRNLDDGNTAPMIGQHTLGRLTSWVEQYSKPLGQETLPNLTYVLAASKATF